MRHGAPWLKPVLVQCAWGAARAKGTYLQAQFFRLKARRGPKKAAIAVAASILTAVYHMLKQGTFYEDLGADYLVKRDAATTVAKLARRIAVAQPLFPTSSKQASRACEELCVRGPCAALAQNSSKSMICRAPPSPCRPCPCIHRPARNWRARFSGPHRWQGGPAVTSTESFG